jgi:hypothetical protein
MASTVGSCCPSMVDDLFELLVHVLGSGWANTVRIATGDHLWDLFKSWASTLRRTCTRTLPRGAE